MAVMLYRSPITKDDSCRILVRKLPDKISLITSEMFDLCYLHDSPCYIIDVRYFIATHIDDMWFMFDFFRQVFTNRVGAIRKIVIGDTLILMGKQSAQYVSTRDDKLAARDLYWISMTEYLYGVSTELATAIKNIRPYGLT